MGFLKSIFGKKETPIQSYRDFWDWFRQKEKTFSQVIKNRTDIEKKFFNELSPKLDELMPGIYFLAGMLDDNTVELVLTPEGIIKKIDFVEELVNNAPPIPGWKFTALKPALGIENLEIEMSGYVYSGETLFFYANDLPGYPDEIDITIVHKDYKEEDKASVTSGAFIFLDNYLGELNFATMIDNLTVIGPKEATKELIPIEKLKSFLAWREKEFLEKCTGIRHDTENDKYAALQAELPNGRPILATMNSTLLGWDSKASHPWIMHIEIKYDGDNNNGMPDGELYDDVNAFEAEIAGQLKDADGYLNIGRKIGDNSREIYFGCKDFRKASRVLREWSRKYSDRLDVSYDIFKDKYWLALRQYENA